MNKTKQNKTKQNKQTNKKKKKKKKRAKSTECACFSKNKSNFWINFVSTVGALIYRLSYSTLAPLDVCVFLNTYRWIFKIHANSEVYKHKQLSVNTYDCCGILIKTCLSRSDTEGNISFIIWIRMISPRNVAPVIKLSNGVTCTQILFPMESRVIQFNHLGRRVRRYESFNADLRCIIWMAPFKCRFFFLFNNYIQLICPPGHYFQYENEVSPSTLLKTIKGTKFKALGTVLTQC